MIGAGASAAQIAATLGNAKRRGLDWRCQCPAHGGCSLTLRNAPDGRLLIKCWAGCDTRQVLAELRRLHLLDRAGNGPSAGDRAERRRDQERWIEIASRIWKVARDASTSPVTRYLAGRG